MPTLAPNQVLRSAAFALDTADVLGIPAAGTTLGLKLYNGDITTLYSQPGTLAAFNALGSGPVLGQTSVPSTTASRSVISVDLNADGLAAILAAQGGRLAWGGTLAGVQTSSDSHIAGYSSLSNNPSDGKTTLRLGAVALGAGTYHWDLNGASAGAGGASPSGVWARTNAERFWNEAPDGQGQSVAWIDGSTAMFSAGSDATGNYTVTLGDNVTVGGVTYSGAAVGSQLTVEAGAGHRISLLAGNNVFDVQSKGGPTSTLAVRAEIAGPGALVKEGQGTLSLEAANSYSGGTTIAAGAVNAAVSGALGTGAVSVGADAALLFSNKADAGKLSISAAAGGAGVNGGFIQFADSSSAGNATLTTQKQAAIDFRDNATAGNAVIENHGDTTVWFNANAGKARITNYAGGQTNFMDDGSAAQATLVNETGGLIDFFDRASADQATVVNKAGGRVRLSNMTTSGLSIGSLEGAGNVTLGSKTLTTGGLNTSTEISGVISGSGGSIVKVGTGTLTLSGANTYTGGTTVSAGAVNAAVSGALSTGAVSVGADAALLFSNKADAGKLSISAAAGGTGVNGGFIQFADSSSAGNATLTTQKQAAIDFRDNATAGNAVIENHGDTTVWFNANAGKAKITNYAGGQTNFMDDGSAAQATLVNETGGLIDFFDRASADQATVVNKAGGRVRLSNMTTSGLSIGSLEGAGNVTLGSKTLTTGGLNTSTEISGVISGSGGSIVKVGTGTLTLSGANTYTGATQVEAGSLRVDNATGSATGTGAVLVKSGATLRGGGIIAGQVTIASGATLAPGSSLGTLTTGMLRLESGASLNYELGQTGAAGGPLNDLIKVNGGLVLDGALNVTESAGGNFGPGLYRLIKYTGSLVDRGLDIGTQPVATTLGDLRVQSSVSGEINLVNSKGVTLGFWDGAGSDTTKYNDGKIAGGSGTWRIGNSTVSDPSDGWTDADGKANTGWQQNQFALFGAAAGTVRVDNSGGAISIGGAQFFTSGYVVTGDALTLGNANTVIKVGDGTASGAQMQATIESALTGSGGLTKDDLGTLILKGANTYTGATLVRAGVLQGDTTSLRGDIVNDARVTFDQAADGTYAGMLSGVGSLRKIGGSELKLAAANSYGGGTLVDGGTLNAAVSGALGSGPVAVNGNAALVFSGTADAGSLRITTAARDGIVNGGFVQFNDKSSAGGATLVTATDANVTFTDASTAGNATIENRGGGTTVWGNANAGSARITNFAGGHTDFLDSGSAAQATLINETGGVVDFFDRATAGQATVLNKAGGVLRISRLATGGIDIGSLEGAGRVLLGAKTLTTGSLNTSTEVSGVIAGAGGSLVKVGTGALTLSGANTYTGGTALRQGRLNLGHSQALGTGTLAMDDDTTLGFSAERLSIANAIHLTGNRDPIIDTGGFSGTLSGAISGAGFITKQGKGTLTLSGANSYTGATLVAQGTLQAGAANTFSAASAHTVAAGATLDLAGFNQNLASLANGGTVSLAGAAAGNTLTIKGAYVGNGGVLKLGTALNGTGPSDRLVLEGASASARGRTGVQVTNVGGLGAIAAGDGIEVITARNGATTTAQTTKDAFSLVGGHVDAGAFEYRLYAGDGAGQGENWYLRSVLRGVTYYRPEVALYAALPGQLRQGNLAMLGDLRKRVGDDDVKGSPTAPTGFASGSDRRAWARVLSTDIDIQQGGTVSPNSKGRLTGFQAGTDLLTTSNWRAGLYVGQLDGDARVSGFASGIQNLGVGRSDLRSQYVGAYGTYTADSGFYADAVVQSGRHRYTVEPVFSVSAGGKGNSLLGSIEVGQTFALGGSGWSIEPQLQLIHQHMDLGNSVITGAVVQPQADSSWIARAGLRMKAQFDTGLGTLQPYGRFNVYKTSSGADIARFVNGTTTTDIAAPTGGTSTELAGGFTLALSPSTSLYGELGKLWASGGNAKVKSSVNGSLGVRAKW
ncbi:outer membrane autotransporter protein [Variovorax boronicumulans]|uniref:autotransporter outer membrane beta-barrel domain-containing protein n=1 Tax=Variovorax boronicumulans TaxID=436515 RepID=UPI002783AE43|nr:autotransporter outer membrane beta-barrel domain-containing protein [Variovorax boronicumulans]MDQ0038562.1 outer membrane autotransporter protein [Variovorax boronicumulans]